jgi:hypothetical protein
VSESDPDDSEIIRILLAGGFGVLWYLALSFLYLLVLLDFHWNQTP